MAQIHFIHIYVDSPTTHIQSSWLSPADRQGAGHGTTAYWQNLARTLERGRFDGIFIADIQSIEPDSPVRTSPSAAASRATTR
jgi:alkanesulfonate monooxygenase SsuD/methylene tetrahydromethanopterin reductase-like flavin-dependent oxidoreductase (luciferase family)